MFRFKDIEWSTATKRRSQWRRSSDELGLQSIYTPGDIWLRVGQHVCVDMMRERCEHIIILRVTNWFVLCMCRCDERWCRKQFIRFVEKFTGRRCTLSVGIAAVNPLSSEPLTCTVITTIGCCSINALPPSTIHTATLRYYNFMLIYASQLWGKT